MKQLSGIHATRKRLDPAGVKSDQHREAKGAKTRAEWARDPSASDLPVFDQRRPQPKDDKKDKD